MNDEDRTSLSWGSAAWARATRETPDRTLLADARDGSAFSVRDADELSRRGVALLDRWGLSAGDRVLVVAAAEVETIIVLWGALRLGVSVVLLHPDAPQQQIRAVAEQSGAAVVLLAKPDPTLPHAAVLCSEEMSEALAEIDAAPSPPEPDPGAEAAILFSSGSTGPARGVRLSRRGLTDGLYRLASAMMPAPGRRDGIPALLHTITGLRMILLAPLALGTTSVLLPPYASTSEILAAAGRERVLELHAGPGLLRACCRVPSRMRALAPSLRSVIIGGGKLSSDERRAFAVGMGVRLAHTYGLTETGGACSAVVVQPDGTGGSGMGRPLCPVRIVRADGALASPGEEGRVLVSPDVPMMGYLDGKAPAEHSGRAWVDTGDLGALSSDGALSVLGRAARTFTTPSGEKVTLADLEALLREVAGVEVVAAVIRPPRRAALIGALVERDSISEVWLARTRAALRARLPAHAIPSLWAAQSPLPRLPSGKLNLVAAQEHLEATA